MLTDLVHHADIRMIAPRQHALRARSVRESAYLSSDLGAGTSRPRVAAEQGLRHGRRFPCHRLQAFRKRGSGTQSSQASRSLQKLPQQILGLPCWQVNEYGWIVFSLACGTIGCRATATASVYSLACPVVGKYGVDTDPAQTANHLGPR